MTEEKKMPNHQEFSCNYCNYVPAVLRHHKDNWQIEYYVFSPITHQLERKRIKVNRLRQHCQSLSVFKQQANEIIQSINVKLAGGWSPFGESENVRYYTKLSEVIDLYIEEKAKELKPDTLRSYKSFCNIFRNWVESFLPGCRCSQLNKTIAIRYMDYVYTERKVSARGYNNQLKMARALFTWAVEKCYSKENPFGNIKVKREQQKKRILIPPEVRQRIRDYFAIHRPNYLIVLELVYTSLLRPAEICRVQVKQVNLNEHYIYMPEDKTKNGHHRYAFLSDELCNLLSPLLKDVSPEDYLLSQGYVPGKQQMMSIRYRKHWDIMRKDLKLPQEMQLYSLRDTGINNMLKAGIDPLTVMQAADHHDLSMTTRYANHIDPNLMNTLLEKAPSF